ncbi:hypothetical protein B0T21DRAFT_454728 [Apiosordaria backusii]|uniref:Fe2OG dioxygenase domain-containing protein n=1 Tax=Apiosordaria backusii TaxID=314023 RepID=A0AA40AAB0_9PEZI|nr:hypothetical protein B0T21DRAFT_454728 [Apiosordaria backusii]
MGPQQQVTQVPVLSLNNIYEGTEDQELLEACMSAGIFYLTLPPEASDYWSWKYKPRGHAIVDEFGTLDQNEFFNISKTTALVDNCSEYQALGLLDAETAENLSNFISSSHDILIIILSRLSIALRLNPENNLATLHRKTANSGDHLRIVKYKEVFSSPPRDPHVHVMLIPHTDFGTLTLIHSEQEGLEFFDAISGEWHPVAPKPGNALVIVGDCLVKFTNGLFRSCLHRVTYTDSLGGVAKAGNTRSIEDKYSLGYFLRPEDDVVLRPVRSPLLNPAEQEAEAPMRSDEWIRRRVAASTAKDKFFSGDLMPAERIKFIPLSSALHAPWLLSRSVVGWSPTLFLVSVGAISIRRFFRVGLHDAPSLLSLPPTCRPQKPPHFVHGNGCDWPEKYPINLQRGWPNPSLIPVQQLHDAASTILSDTSAARDVMQYHPPGGYPPMLQGLARLLSSFYPRPGGISPSRLMITGGASAGLVNMIQRFTDPNWTHAVWMVAPTYFLACRMFEDVGFRGKLRSVPEDSEEVSVEYLKTY